MNYTNNNLHNFNDLSFITFQSQIEEWIKECDFDQDGRISLEEFKLGIAGTDLCGHDSWSAFTQCIIKLKCVSTALSTFIVIMNFFAITIINDDVDPLY